MKKIKENIYSIDSWLDEMLGAEGTLEREENNRKAEEFFTENSVYTHLKSNRKSVSKKHDNVCVSHWSKEEIETYKHKHGK